MTVSLKLTRPIEAHDETLTELNFREPNGKDIAECGLPFATEADGSGTRMKPDTKAVSAFIVRLCGIPATSVGMMSATDFIAAMGIIFDFFGDTAIPRPS